VGLENCISKKDGDVMSNKNKELLNIDKNYIVCLSIIIMFSAIMRFKGLDTESFWLDELTTLSAISQGTWRGAMEGWLSMVGMGTWLMYYWKLIVGDSDFALRSISAISGILLVIIVAEFTRRFHDKKAAIISSSMLSISHLAILYSQEFRPYMFTTTFIWISFFLMRMERKLSKFEIGICIILLSFSYLVHYVAGLVIVLGLIGDFSIRVIKEIRDKEGKVFSKRKRLILYLRSKSGQCLKICFGVAMLAVFMLEKMKYDSTNTNHSMWINDVPERPVVTLFDYFFAFDIRGNITDVAEAMWYFVLLTPVLLYLHRKFITKRKIFDELEWFVWIVGGGTMFVIVLYSLEVRNLWVSRYFVFSMPAWYILFGIGISRVIDLITGYLPKNNLKNIESRSFLVAILFSFFFVLNSTHWYVNEFEYYEKGGRSDFKGMSEWLDDNIENNQEEVFIISQPYAKYWNLYLERMDSHVEIDEHTSWGDVETGQVVDLIDEGPFEVIHLRGHKKSMWGYESLTLALAPNYELVDSLYFIEGQIDIYHRIKNNGIV
tara:strand:- start:14197 stop:15840 length:1644 start_codon:yes stop_codon:yes gene_type:complete